MGELGLYELPDRPAAPGHEQVADNPPGLFVHPAVVLDMRDQHLLAGQGPTGLPLLQLQPEVVLELGGRLGQAVHVAADQLLTLCRFVLLVQGALEVGCVVDAPLEVSQLGPHQLPVQGRQVLLGRQLLLELFGLGGHVLVLKVRPIPLSD
jgi:hypothetical protein